jgi:hypothetical protein
MDAPRCGLLLDAENGDSGATHSRRAAAMLLLLSAKGERVEGRGWQRRTGDDSAWSWIPMLCLGGGLQGTARSADVTGAPPLTAARVEREPEQLATIRDGALRVPMVCTTLAGWGD